MKKEGTQSVCGTCLKLFYLPPSHRKEVNYCSTKCKGAAQSSWQRRDLATRFWEKVQKSDHCWLWMGALLKTGYGSIRVNHKAERAHRIAYELAKGPIPDGLLVLHSCDNPRCVNPDHLSVGSKSKNTQEAIERGLHQTGEKSSKSRLSDMDVATIRAAVVTGVPGRHLAQRFGVTESTISSIKHFRRWKHNGL